MWLYDRARQQYGISEDSEIPEYMSRDPPEYQSFNNYTSSPTSRPLLTYQQNTVMAEPVVDSDLIIAESSYAVPVSVYRRLKIKIDELEKQLDLCLRSYEKIHESRSGQPVDKIELLSKNPITKIESRSGQLVDRIELHFYDGSIKEYGGKGGAPNESFILKPNEKIIKVVQYESCKYGNGQFLGCRIDFHTNFDRIYKIAGAFCKMPCEPWRSDYSDRPQKVFNVPPGKYLTGLIFGSRRLEGRSVLKKLELNLDMNGGSKLRKKNKTNKKLSTRGRKMKYNKHIIQLIKT